jgi:hypothetical protein
MESVRWREASQPPVLPTAVKLCNARAIVLVDMEPTVKPAETRALTGTMNENAQLSSIEFRNTLRRSTTEAMKVNQGEAFAAQIRAAIAWRQPLMSLTLATLAGVSLSTRPLQPESLGSMLPARERQHSQGCPSRSPPSGRSAPATDRTAPGR